MGDKTNEERAREVEGFQGALHEISDALFNAGVTAEQWESAEARICNALALLSSEQSHDSLSLASRVAELERALREAERPGRDYPGAQCTICNARVPDIDPYDPPDPLPEPEPHEADCPFALLPSPSPIAEAGAEVLEATVEYRDACDAFEAAEGREEIAASGDRMHEAFARLDAAEIKYQFLLNEGMKQPSNDT